METPIYIDIEDLPLKIAVKRSVSTVGEAIESVIFFLCLYAGDNFLESVKRMCRR